MEQGNVQWYQTPFQWIGEIQRTKTCFSIHRNKYPLGEKFTYSRIICEICSQKKEAHIVWLTLGGDKFTFDRSVFTPKSKLTTSKLHWNSVISTPGAKYLMLDVNNFYPDNPMYTHEYYKIVFSLISQEIIYKENLVYKQFNGFLCVRA